MDKNEEEIKDDGEHEILDFNKPDYSFTPQGNHEWRQQGPYLVCKSCELEHAVWVGIDRQMIGISEDGRPILKVIA